MLLVIFTFVHERTNLLNIRGQALPRKTYERRLSQHDLARKFFATMWTTP
jgi:hypothetical protein